MATWYPEGYGSNQKYYYPPAPPPLNPNPPPWRGYQPRPKNTDSDRTSSSASQASVPLVHGRAADLGYPQVDLMDGVDYFKIGDMVRIRRWNATTDSFSEWATGQIVRPIVVENLDGTQKRSYLCSYERGRAKERKERQFSPHFQEIASFETDPVPYAPALRPGNGGRLVFAPIPVRDPSGTSKQIVYSPAAVLTSPNEQGGVRLRVLAGPAAKREIDNFAIQHAPPYTAESAQMLRQKGFRVEGNGINRSF